MILAIDKFENHLKVLLNFESLHLNERISTRTPKVTKDIEATGEDTTALNEELLESLRLMNY